MEELKRQELHQAVSQTASHHSAGGFISLQPFTSTVTLHMFVKAAEAPRLPVKVAIVAMVTWMFSVAELCLNMKIMTLKSVTR